MEKRPKPIFLILGLVLSLLAGIVIGRALRYKNPTVLANFTNLPEQKNFNLIQPDELDVTPLPLQETLPDEVFLIVPELTEEPDWMKFGGLDLLNGKVSFDFETTCDGGEKVVVPPVKIVSWHLDVFEDGEFGIGKNVAVAWEHLGYEGLWIHSGWDFWSERSPATDLQYFIETDELNEVQQLERIESRLNECLLGNQVSLEQQGKTFGGEVAAAVRVPATGVKELSKHTMDLVPYLAQTYPQSGFAELEENALLIFFCGRAALDERTDPEAGYWTQTRYVIAIEPLK
jgi:hypothetical protein